MSNNPENVEDQIVTPTVDKAEKTPQELAAEGATMLTLLGAAFFTLLSAFDKNPLHDNLSQDFINNPTELNNLLGLDILPPALFYLFLRFSIWVSYNYGNNTETAIEPTETE